MRLPIGEAITFTSNQLKLLFFQVYRQHSTPLSTPLKHFLHLASSTPVPDFSSSSLEGPSQSLLVPPPLCFLMLAHPKAQSFVTFSFPAILNEPFQSCGYSLITCKLILPIPTCTWNLDLDIQLTTQHLQLNMVTTELLSPYSSTLVLPVCLLSASQNLPSCSVKNPNVILYSSISLSLYPLSADPLFSTFQVSLNSISKHFLFINHTNLKLLPGIL